MATNFPNSPSNGATHTFAGRTYTYSSSIGGWTAQDGTPVATGTSAPSSPEAGDLWFDSSSATLFFYYADGSSNQWVSVSGPAGPTGPTGATGATGPAGAAGSTTVVANTTALLAISSPSAGDMAYVTGNSTLYFYNGSGWYKIALINATPSISGANASYSLATDGTATTVTIVASDPEGLPITYSIASDTSGNIATVAQGTGASTNVWTITPSTNTAHAGTFSLTFRASDGVNFATAASSFSLQFAVQNQNYTTALITSVGSTNNGTNSSFDDKSTSNHTLTAAGAAHQTTFSPYRHGGYSTYFDGSGDYLTSNSNGIANFGTGAFTIEGWLYLVAYPSQWNFVLDTRSSGSDSNGFCIEVTPSDFGIYAGENMCRSGSGFGLKEWKHWAYTRDSSGNHKVFINGTQVGSTFTGSKNYTTDNFRVSASHNGGDNQNAYQRDLRVIKGTALYTANFTPPTEPLTAVTNTSFLGCHLPYFADGSTNGNTITISGDTHMRPFSPYDAQEYATGSHGGSISLDGSGDSISAAASADFGFGTGDFTVEWWIYFDSIGSYPYQIDMRSADNDTPLALFTRTNLQNQLGVYVSASIIASGTYSFVPKRWTHYAICKTGGYLKGYFDGKEDFSIACTRDYGSSESIRIGAVYGNGSYFVDGNIADVRIVKGTAVYTSAFTPPTAPLSAVTNTKLLVQSTDGSIIDKAQASRQTELIGTVSSTTYTKYYNSSIYFDGSNDYIQLSDAENLPGPFTIEMWMYVPTGSISQSDTFLTIGTTGTSANCMLLYRKSADNKIAIWNGGSTILTSSTAIPQGQWAHLAITRNSSNTINIWIDGVDKGSVSNTNDFIPGTHGIKLGTENPLGFYYIGYMSDVRITKGLARYTSAFTAPTAALKG